MEMFRRRKILLFHVIGENKSEVLSKMVTNLITDDLDLADFTTSVRVSGV